MAYAILRVAKLKTPGNIGGVNAHLTRSMNVPNADPELSRYNGRLIGSDNLLNDVKTRLEQAGITKPRKDAVLAVEHLMTASPEHFNFQVKKGAKGEKIITGNGQHWDEFKKASVEWLKERYGERNVVNVTLHLDEQSPHIHAIVVPIDSKGKLNCKSFLGGREKLRDMQSSFADKMQPYGLERGIEGSKAHHQEVKTFYGHVKDFYRDAPSVEIDLIRPSVEVKPPEKGFFGIGGEDPAAKAQQETFRINQELIDAEKRNKEKISNRLKEYHRLASEAKMIKVENKALKGQMGGLKDQVKTLQTTLDTKNRNTTTLINAIANGSVKIDELKSAMEIIPAKGDKRLNMIREFLKETGIPVKEEQKIIPQKKRGLGL